MTFTDHIFKRRQGRTDIRKNSKMADYLDWALLTIALFLNFSSIVICVFFYFCWSKVVRKKRCYPTPEEMDVEKTGNIENSLHNSTRNISTTKQTFKITQPKIIRRNTQTQRISIQCFALPRRLQGMAIQVVEFSNGGYKIRKIFAQESTYSKEIIEFEFWINGELSKRAKI